MGLKLVLRSTGQQITYESKPSRGRNAPEVFRIKSDVTNTPVRAHTGQIVDSIEEVDNSEISTMTVGDAIAEIREYVPDLSGYDEDQVRDMLLEGSR